MTYDQELADLQVKLARDALVGTPTPAQAATILIGAASTILSVRFPPIVVADLIVTATSQALALALEPAGTA